jgi:hypothetical protein
VRVFCCRQGLGEYAVGDFIVRLCHVDSKMLVDIEYAPSSDAHLCARLLREFMDLIKPPTADAQLVSPASSRQSTTAAAVAASASAQHAVNAHESDERAWFRSYNLADDAPFGAAHLALMYRLALLDR